MQNIERTLASQYANSPTLVQLVRNFNQYIDPSADIDAFVSNVMDVTTAQGFGLDIWGRIVGVSRNIKVTAALVNFGFSEGVDYQPFGQAPLYAGSSSSVYSLSDDAFRKLILVKALSNISDCTAASFNQLLQNLFAGRGRCYVQDTGGMAMRYVFEFDLLPYEASIIANSGAFPRPAGVSANVLGVTPSKTFGFSESGSFQPFGQGSLMSSSQLINVA